MDKIDKIKNDLGQRIRELRKKQNLSIEDLAEKADLHTTYTGDIERGKVNATVTALTKIADALKIELYDLFRFSDSNINEKILIDRFNQLIKNKEKISTLQECQFILKELFY